MDELHDILPGLQAKLGALSGNPEPLDGGITNRNFRATLGGVEYVIRRPGKDTDLLGIDRDAERLANEAASTLGIAPAVATTLDDCLVTRFLTCSPIDAIGLQEGVEELALALRSFHDSGLQLPTRFWVPELLEDYARIAVERGGSLAGGYDAARSAAALIQEALPLTSPRPCHNDLLPGNIICAERRLMIVDWEYAGMGDPRFDLGNLSVNNDFDEAMDERLLAAYEGGPPSDASRAALNLMRVLSDAREGAWAVVQGRVSALDFDFDAYGREHFERLQEAVERESFAEWLSAAREAASGKAS